MSIPHFTDWCAGHRTRVDTCLQSRFVDAWPDAFKQAVLYPLRTGGKRIRPLFAFAAAEALGAEVTDDLVHVGSAVELIHTYSLVHDDLPCMDDDPIRRGKPSVHVAYGDGPAVLVGDALLTEAFRTVTHTNLPAEIQVHLVAELAQGAGHAGMIGGQAADVGMDGAVEDLAALTKLHRGKTGALIRAANRMGGIAAGANSDQIATLTRYGDAIGLAFQMADDVLDAEQDAHEMGTPSYVRLMGVDETQKRARELLDEALAAIASLPSPTGLEALARYTVERDH